MLNIELCSTNIHSITRKRHVKLNASLTCGFGRPESEFGLDFEPERRKLVFDGMLQLPQGTAWKEG